MVEVQEVLKVDPPSAGRTETKSRKATAWEWSSKTPFPLEELELLQSQIGSFPAQASRVQESLKRHVGERNRSHLENR